MSKSIVDLSVIVTAHAEGIILHKTLKSIERAVRAVKKRGLTCEIILHVDNPTPQTAEYLKANKDYVAAFKVYKNSFSDAGASRNYCVTKAAGTFVTFIDGDDLVSQNWLIEALTYLKEHSGQDIVAHAELTVEFGDTSSVVIKHGEIDKTSDSLLSVFANRWNAIIMTKRTVLLKNPYEVDPAGFGYEDWNLNNRFIYHGYHNILIPKTAIFVRRKSDGSRWAAHQRSMSILRANPLLSFEYIRSLTVPAANSKPATSNVSAGRSLARKGKRLLKKYPRAYEQMRRYYLQFAQNTQPRVASNHRLPAWLLEEWQKQHAVEKILYPSQEILSKTVVYDSLTSAHWQVGRAYKRVVDALSHNLYDYILFVPWVITGGADKFAVAYANRIQEADPQKRVLVLATLPFESPWQGKLKVDFVPFGQLTEDLTPELQMRVLEQLIENSGADYLHIINSALGYAFIENHHSYIINSGKHVIVTSFSQSSDDTGRIFGYSHTHVPAVYEDCEVVVSDNATVIGMWQKEYGFDPYKLLLHRPAISGLDKLAHKQLPITPLRVLWAARIAPEKIPQLVSDIGRLLQGKNITIDMYGNIDDGMDTSFLQSLPPAVRYRGGFDGFSSLPVKDYDAFLYTSIFDGIPNVLLEAGAAGIPIVASAAGGIPEIIQDMTTGLLITDIHHANAYASALVRLQQDTVLYGTLRNNLYQKLLTEYSEASQKKAITAMLRRIGYIA